MFDVEKPVVFLYEEIFSATDGFLESNLLGLGTYGAVYHGLLRDQVGISYLSSFVHILYIFFELWLIYFVHYCCIIVGSCYQKNDRDKN